MRSFSKRTLFFFVLILILGFFLRAQETLSHNFLFLIDQGRDMQAVKSIVYDHHLTLLGPYTSLQGVFQGPLWYYLLSVPTFLFGGNPWGAVFLMLIISMGTLVLCFFLMQKLFSTQAALITTFLFAISPEAIAAATYAWNPHPMWFFILVYLFSLFQLVLGKKKYHLFVWPTISLMFHFETALGFFILVATFLYLILFQRKLFLTKEFLLGLLLLFLFFIPQIVFDLRHDFLMSKSFLSIFHGKDQGLFTKGEQVPYLNIIDGHKDTFIINYQSAFQRIESLPQLPFLLFILSVFLFNYGIREKIFKHEEHTFLLLHLRLIVIIFLLTCLYPFPLRYWFLTGFQVFYILPLGLLFSIYLKNKLVRGIFAIFCMLMLLIILPKIYILYTKPDYGGTAKIQGKIDAIDYVYTDADKTTFGLLVFTPPVNTDAYDYLVWWQSKKKNRVIPPKEKKNIFYLLMEPDPNNQDSYNGWRETVVKTGRTLSEKKLPSGIIIEKRIAD